MKIQMAHEATRSYAEQIYNIVKENQPSYKNALEIGAAWGVSTLAILQAGNGKLMSVDIDPNVKALSEVEANNLQDRHEFVHSWAKDFWEKRNLGEIKPKQFDIVYVDGGHTYEMAHLDIQQGWNALKVGGLFMVDDYVHKYNKEVHPGDKEPHFGVAIALMEHIFNNQITKIGTMSNIFWTIKE